MAVGKACRTWVVLGALSIGLPLSDAVGQGFQPQLAEDLRRYVRAITQQEDDQRLLDLLHEVSAIPAEDRERELRDALIDALSASQQPDTWIFADHETPFFLLKAVVELEDPLAIPAIAQAMGSGLMASRALIALGPQAADHVLDVVATAPMTDSRVIAGGLMTLRMMVERAGSDAAYGAWLDDQDNWSKILSVAIQHLEPLQDDGAVRGRYRSLVRAIDLAFVVQDEGLRGTLRLLATDDGEVKARGVSEPDQVDGVRRRASSRLAGVQPMPRR